MGCLHRNGRERPFPHEHEYLLAGLDPLHYFFNLGNIHHAGAYSPPNLATLRVDEDGGTESDVLPPVPIRVKQAIITNHLGAWIAENRELPIGSFFPRFASMGNIVNTEGDNLDIALVEIAFVLRELAQLAHAKGSPVAAIKDKQYRATMQRGESEVVTILVFEREVGSRLALRRRDLRLRHLHDAKD